MVTSQADGNCSLPAEAQAVAELGEGSVLLGGLAQGAKILIFWGQKGVRGGGRGEAGSRTCLYSMITCHPSPGFSHRKSVCLSGPQDRLEWICGGLGRLLAAISSLYSLLSGFAIRAPQSESRLCLLLTLWPGARNLPEPRVFRCQKSHALITRLLWKETFLLPEKSKSFVIITLMSNDSS